MKNLFILLFIVTVGGAIAAGEHTHTTKSTTNTTEYNEAGDMQAEEDTSTYDSNNNRKERTRVHKDTVKEKTYDNGVKRKTRTTTETVNP